MGEIEEIQKKFGVVGREKELEKALSVIKVGRHLLIEGPVGVGKTVIALAISNHLNKPVYRVDGDERYTEQKLTGWFDPPVVLKLGYVKEAFIPGQLTMAMQNGGVLFINELNRMPEAVQNVLLPSMDEFKIEIPKIGRINAKSGFTIIATQNPREFIATSSISEALRDRFELVTLDYQPEEEEIEIVRLRTGVNDHNLLKAVVLIARATRGHPDIRRGTSIRAAISICMLALQLGRNVDAIRKACHMALPTRIELMEDAKKPLPNVIDEVVDAVLEKTTPNSFELKVESQDVDVKKNDAIIMPQNFMEVLSKFIKFPSDEGGGEEVGWVLAQQYPEVKLKVDENLRKVIKRIAIKAILLRALEMLGPTKRSAKLKRVIYQFGKDEIDLDSTLEQILGKKEYQPEDIIVETREKKKLSCALIVDTSLSMAGEKLAVAAVGAAVLALKLKDDNYSLITFETDARLLKGMNESKGVESVISDLLETPATGHTNIEDGLRTGLNELEKARTGERLGVIITDGECTRGYHPEEVAIRYPKLCVIMIEGPVQNLEFSMKLARLGKGKMYKVKDFNEVPRVLYNLLREVA